MNDRDFKKWRPFNSVVPARELLSGDDEIDIPVHSKDELDEYEEKLKMSLYLKMTIEVKYIENNKIKVIRGYVLKLDSLKKNIYFKGKTINFRQIVNIK